MGVKIKKYLKPPPRDSLCQLSCCGCGFGSENLTPSFCKAVGNIHTSGTQPLPCPGARKLSQKIDKTYHTIDVSYSDIYSFSIPKQMSRARAYMQQPYLYTIHRARNLDIYSMNSTLIWRINSMIFVCHTFWHHLTHHLRMANKTQQLSRGDVYHLNWLSLSENKALNSVLQQSQ